MTCCLSIRVVSTWPALFAALLALPACQSPAPENAQLEMVDLTNGSGDPCKEDVTFSTHAYLDNVGEARMIYSLSGMSSSPDEDPPLYILDDRALVDLPGYSSDEDRFDGDYTFTVPGATKVMELVELGYLGFEVDLSICLGEGVLQDEYKKSDHPLAGWECLVGIATGLTCSDETAARPASAVRS